MGTPALTTRGLVESDMEKVVDFIDRGLKLAKEILAVSGPKLVDFKEKLHKEFNGQIESLRNEVENYSQKFPIPGYPDM